MSLHSQFKTDATLENAGIAIQYGPNDDGSVPEFVISRTGKSNKKYTKALEAATKPYRRQIDLGTMNNDLAEKLFMGVFIDTILKSWSNVQDEKGKDIAFTKQAAIKLFSELPELYDDLQDKSKNAGLFREADLEDDAKN